MSEYEESCMECGFNQKDQDLMEKHNSEALISEFVEDLRDMRSIRYDPNKIDYYIKKWEEKLK